MTTQPRRAYPGLPSHSLLGPHVCLRDADFVHKLAKSNGVVTGELAEHLGWAWTREREDSDPNTPTWTQGPWAGSGRRKWYICTVDVSACSR